MIRRDASQRLSGPLLTGENCAPNQVEVYKPSTPPGQPDAFVTRLEARRRVDAGEADYIARGRIRLRPEPVARVVYSRRGLSARAGDELMQRYAEARNSNRDPLAIVAVEEGIGRRGIHERRS